MTILWLGCRVHSREDKSARMLYRNANWWCTLNGVLLKTSKARLKTFHLRRSEIDALKSAVSANFCRCPNISTIPICCPIRASRATQTYWRESYDHQKTSVDWSSISCIQLAKFRSTMVTASTEYMYVRWLKTDVKNVSPSVLPDSHFRWQETLAGEIRVHKINFLLHA